MTQYWDWQRGVPPSREWRGRGGQNPHLLAAFRRLAKVERELERRGEEPAPKRTYTDADREQFKSRLAEMMRHQQQGSMPC